MNLKLFRKKNHSFIHSFIPCIESLGAGLDDEDKSGEPHEMHSLLRGPDESTDSDNVEPRAREGNTEANRGRLLV